MVLICISWITINIEHFLMCLLVIYISSFMKWQFKSSVNFFFNWAGCLLATELKVFFILNTRLCLIYVLQIFSSSLCLVLMIFCYINFRQQKIKSSFFQRWEQVDIEDRVKSFSLVSLGHKKALLKKQY